MKWIIFVLLMVVAILMVVCYALLVMAQNEKDRADRLYRAWRERNDK